MSHTTEVNPPRKAGLVSGDSPKKTKPRSILFILIIAGLAFLIGVVTVIAGWQPLSWALLEIIFAGLAIVLRRGYKVF